MLFTSVMFYFPSVAADTTEKTIIVENETDFAANTPHDYKEYNINEVLSLLSSSVLSYQELSEISENMTSDYELLIQYFNNDEYNTLTGLLDSYINLIRYVYIDSDIIKDDLYSYDVYNDLAIRKSQIKQYADNTASKFMDARPAFAVNSVVINDNDIDLEIYEWVFIIYNMNGILDISGFGIKHSIRINDMLIITSDTLIESFFYNITENIVKSTDEINNQTKTEIELNDIIGNSVTYNYNPDAAITYADTYWSNYNENYYNFNDYGGDCANFVSQCLYTGGIPMVTGTIYGSDGWFYVTASNRSATWTGANSHRNWFLNYGVKIDNPTSAQVLKGNPVYYNTDSDSNYEHVAICVGVNNSGTPVVNAHNSDVYRVPWTLGYNKTSTIQLDNTDPDTPVDYITTQGEISLISGDFYDIYTEIYPSDATNKILTYTSSNTDVVSLSATGRITAIIDGSSLITVTSLNGVTATLTVFVYDMPADNNYSEWVNKLPAVVNGDDYLIEEKTMYRYSTSTAYSDWSDAQTTTTAPTASNTLEIISTSKTYNYYHYCCNYYDGMYNVDSILYGTGGHLHTLSRPTVLPTADSTPDKGGKQFYGYSTCSCGFNIWVKSDNFEVTTYTYRTRTEYITGWSEWQDTYPVLINDETVMSMTMYRFIADNLQSISILALPNKSIYHLNEPFDETGLRINGLYLSGDIAEITTGYTITGFDSTIAGEKTIIVDYNGLTVDFMITVDKGISVIITDPIASPITYGQALVDSNLTGGVASVDGSFAWTDGSIVPLVSDSGTTLYSVTFTPKDTVNYESITTNITLTVHTLNADIVFDFIGVAVKLIEPWGLRFYTLTSGSDFSSILPFGTIVLHEDYYTEGMTAEEMMVDSNAIILTSESGDSILDSSSRIVGTIVGGIYTYTMNTSFYTAAYVVINGEYIFSSVNSRNIYDRISYLKDNSSNSYEKAIYQEMYNLYTDVKTYHDSLGTVTIPEPQTIKRGSECSAGTVAENNGTVLYDFIGVSIRLIEPWGLCFYMRMTTADIGSVTEFGTVVLSRDDYTDGMTGEGMRLFANSYVFNSTNETAVYDASNRIVAKLVDSIYTYNMDKTFYTVSYAVIGGEYYYSDVNSRCMYDRVLVLKETSSNAYEKDIYASMYSLYGAVDAYHRSLGLK